MTPDETAGRIEAAIASYGPAASAIIERLLAQVNAESGAAAVNALIDRLDLELRYNIPPIEYDGD